MEYPIASPEKIAELIRQMLPDFDNFLSKIKESQLHLPDDFQKAIRIFQIENYSLYYLQENDIKKLFVNFMGDQELKNLLEKPIKIPISTAREIIDNTLTEISVDLQNSEDELEDIDFEEVQSLSESEFEQFKQFIVFVILFFHDLTCLIVFGERIFSLVQKVVSGDRKSLLKVIQIDPSTLNHIPEFQEIHAKAILSRDKRFLNSINHYLNNRTGMSRLKHRHIYLVFYYLHTFQCLESMTASELFDFCDAVELTKFEEIADERGMRRLKNQFLESQKVGSVNTMK